MNFLRQNRVALGLVAAVGLTLVGIAIVRSELRESDKSPPQTPKIADVIVMAGSSRQTLQIRDPQAIVVLQTLLDGGRVINESPSGRHEFEVFVHPPDKQTYPYAPAPVWRTADGGYVWRHDGRVAELNGSLADFLEWLKIRRLNQLLRRPDPKQRRLAQQLREATRTQHVESLLRIANSTNGWFAQAGIREIAEFISVEPPQPYQFIPGELRLPGSRAVVDPDRRVLSELVGLVKRSPRADHADDPFGVGDMALACLQQVGDRATADALVKLLKQHQGGRLGEQLLATIERLYGIPATYERFGICGNSSPAEIAKFAQAEAKRQAAAIDDLLAWQRDHVDDTGEEFYDAVVLRWSEMLVHMAKTPDRNSYDSDRTPAPKLTNLLALGQPVVPALSRRIQAANGWAEAAMLEFCIACLTGEGDAVVVTGLFDGDFAQQRAACSIVAATADPNWNDRLAALLRTPIPDRNVEEVVVLRDIAAQALYRSSGIDALPVLRAALNEGFESQMLLQILQHFELPEAEY